MDVVWLLGAGSKIDNWELRISMRSFRANYKSEGAFWLIGTIPDWVDRSLVRCIEWPDPYRRCKDANLLGKVLRMAFEADLSEMFILCSDDHYLLRASTAEECDWWHGGEIGPMHPKHNEWQQRLSCTGEALRKAGVGAKNYEMHIPYRLRKDWAKEALRYDFGASPMTIFSTILNTVGVWGAQITKDVRADIRGEHSLEAIQRKTAASRYALTDGSLAQNPDAIAHITSLFPEPAPWELAPHSAEWPPVNLSRQDQVISHVDIPEGLRIVLPRMCRFLAPGTSMPLHYGRNEYAIHRLANGSLAVAGGVTVQPHAPTWGPPLWQKLHEGAETPAKRMSLVLEITAAIPCPDCQAHWRGLIAELQPRAETAETFFAWTVAVHNRVNKRIGKPEVSLPDAQRLHGRRRQKIALLIRGFHWRTADRHGYPLDARQFVPSLLERVIEPLREHHDLTVFLATYHSPVIAEFRILVTATGTLVLQARNSSQAATFVRGLEEIRRRGPFDRVISTRCDLVYLKSVLEWDIWNREGIFFPWKEFGRAKAPWPQHRRVGDAIHVIDWPFLDAFQKAVSDSHQRTLHWIQPPLADQPLHYIERGIHDSDTLHEVNPLYRIGNRPRLSGGNPWLRKKSEKRF